MKSKFSIWYLLAVFVMVSLVVTACGGGDGSGEAAGETDDESFKAAIVTDIAGLGDQSFNDSANRGLTRAAEELGIETQVYETSQPSDYEPNLVQAPAQGSDLTFAIGFLMTDALEAAATQRPDARFAIVDSVVEADNVASILFREEEGSFLVGALAGLMTESDKVGFIGGLEVPLIKKFEVGYRAGVQSVNPDAEILITYSGSFDDPGRGKEIALSQYADGADVIYHASGGTGLGLFQAAQERGPGFWAIGVDSDQYELAPENTLTSMMKRVDVAVFQMIEQTMADNFQTGTVVFGLEDDAVGLAPTTDQNTPQEVIDQVNELRQRVIDGEIAVPSTEAELAEFEPPQS